MGNPTIERKKYLRNGGKLECPFCKRGMISMVQEEVIKCDNCNRTFIGRKPIKIVV